MACGRSRSQLVFDRLVAQQQGGLAQVIVEEDVRLGEGVAIDEPAANGTHEQYAAEQPDEQAGADGIHAGRTR